MAEMTTRTQSCTSITVFTDPVGAVWTEMPAELTEFLGLTIHRSEVDLAALYEARLIVSMETVGFSTAALRAQYSTDGAIWNYMDGESGPSVIIDALGLLVSAWVPIVAAAQANVKLRIVGISGDGATDPRFARVELQCR